MSTGAQFPNNVGQAGWNPSLDKILQSGATAPSKLQRAIQRIRDQNPELNLKQILRRTAELGLSSWKNNWTEDEKTFVLDHAREFSVADIARRLGRTPRAVYQLLWRSGESAKFQDGYTQCQLAQELHVSPRKVRQWVRLGWLILYQGRVKDRSLQRFLEEHSNEVDTTRLDKDLLAWLRDLGLREGATHSRRWLSTRQHSLKEHACGRCGRKVHGNAFHRHIKVCTKRACSPAKGSVESRLN